jgi:hypothetical protein
MRILPLFVLTFGACAAAPASHPQTGEPTVSNVPRLTVNALSPAAIAASELTTDVLDATSAAEMGTTQYARKTLAFAVSCALRDDQSVTFTVDGTEYTDHGAMGMAPGWVSDGLSNSEAAWISACLLARVNLTSTVVSISARGDAPGLETTTSEEADYQIEEGAFWGNAFVDLGSVAQYSCNGVDQAADDSYGDLPYRQCAQWDGVTGSNLSPCGMHYAGLCSDVCSSSGTYAGCSFSGGTAVSSVITTFLSGEPEE